MHRINSLSVLAMFCILAIALPGCAGGRPSIIPNSDKSLRKSSTQFAADAAKRHPFNPHLPEAGEAVGRAQVGYALNVVQVRNSSDEDWADVDLWLNRTHVCHVDNIPAKGQRVTSLDFTMFYDDQGNYFPLDNKKPQNMVRQFEMVRDGKIYTIPLQLAD